MKYIAYVTLSVVSMFIGAMGAAVVLNEAMPYAMFKEFRSPYDHARTVEVITQRIERQPGWNVVSVIDQAETIRQGGGGDVGRYSIIKFCSPVHAGRMLEDDRRRFYGVAMPLSVGVYEMETGEVWVSFMNGALISRMFGGEIEGIANDVRLDVEEMFSFLHVEFDVFGM